MSCWKRLSNYCIHVVCGTQVFPSGCHVFTASNAEFLMCRVIFVGTLSKSQLPGALDNLFFLCLDICYSLVHFKGPLERMSGKIKQRIKHEIFIINYWRKAKSSNNKDGMSRKANQLFTSLWHGGVEDNLMICINKFPTRQFIKGRRAFFFCWFFAHRDRAPLSAFPVRPNGCGSTKWSQFVINHKVSVAMPCEILCWGEKKKKERK